jgi:hypothetical protein
MNKYGKKQKKHTRSIFLNTDDAVYVDSERKTFRFAIAPINIEDESKLYVENTIIDYKTGNGLGVKGIVSGLFLGSTATYPSTYSANPLISFTPQNGKGSGATGMGFLAPSGVSGSATATTTTVNATVVGQGYTGAIPTIAATTTTGGSGATLTPNLLDNINGGFGSTATLVAGSGYSDTPVFIIPAPQATVLATFGAVPYTASTGVITGVPTVTNASTNGFYGTGFATATFVNNPITASGIFQTNATGGIVSVIIENSADNGYYGTDHPLTLPSIVGGTGFTFTPTYSGGRAVSVIVTAAGSGYGNNLTDYPFTAGLPATPVAGAITGITLSQGRMTALTTFTGGSKYYKPTMTTGGTKAPIQAVYEPVFKIASLLAGAKILTSGKGYTLPPTPVVAATFRVANNGDLPLIAEMAPVNLLEGNSYYTIKADGFQFNRSLYSNSDNKGLPTIAICSTNEIVNNEEHSDLILPAQVINDITLTIHDRDSNGLDPLRNLAILIKIEELDDDNTEFKASKRQDY